MSHFSNAYADPDRAASYSSLEFPATYALAFRDLPALFRKHGVSPESGGLRALDFGCGAGRSTRFLRGLGFDVLGVDISAAMLARARELDADAGAGSGAGAGDRYVFIDDDPAALPPGPFDLVLAAYPFDNIPGEDHRAALLTGLRERLAPARVAESGARSGGAGRSGSVGRLVLVASSPELYVHEWATFTTAAYPENASAGSGDPVRIAIKEGGDPRPVHDLRWFDRDYRSAFDRAGLEVLEVHRPLATGDEPHAWVNETEIAPWVIYVAGASSRT